ncbi:desampylase [Halobellus captivus]|uniref:desampylase n=1 Tax=Halobellus captivus TaxID=2592614 RepID=UPI0011A758C4|nr:desampylase [Halobellus captivus]
MNPTTLTLTRDVYDEIVYQGYGGADEEICGILGGEFGDEESVVHEVRQVANIAETPQIRYAMDPEEQLAATETLEDAGYDVVGFYHTHPTGPPRPSETDAARATWPGYSYAICAFDGYPFVGSWRWTDEGFQREIVGLIDGSRQ